MQCPAVVIRVVCLGLLTAASVLVVVACGGGGAGGDGGGAGGGGAEAEQKEQAKARKFPDYGELRPGKYLTHKFEPAFSFRVVGKGWVVVEGSERTLVEMSQGVAGPILAFLSAEQVFNPSKVRELDSMPAPEDMVAWLRQHPYLRTDEPQAAAIGGVEGVRLDAVVASVPPTECGGDCLGLFTVGDRSYDWGAYEKKKTALHRAGKRRRREGNDSRGGARRRLRGVLAQGAGDNRHGGVERRIEAPKLYSPNHREKLFGKSK